MPTEAVAFLRATGWNGAKTITAPAVTCPGRHSVDVPHAASANHRIPRDPDRENRFRATSGRSGRDSLQLLVFYRERLNAEERAEVELERGVALCREGARVRGSHSRCLTRLWPRAG